jgi:flavin-dependent dehydrogenase
MPSRKHDVIIIGGGPAGSVAATMLAKKGHSVAVLEKTKFPREHVGESLLPFCYPIFKKLGILKELTRRYVRKPGVRFVDVDGSHFTTWCFGHVLKDPSHLSFHVLRAEFDQLLLENARKHGATVKEETRVTSVDLSASDRVTVQAVGPRGGRQTLRGRLLLDASGRDTFMATRKRWKRPHDEFDRSALSTHWTGAKYVDGIEEGLLQIVYLGGEKKGWIWMIPVGIDRVSVGVVLNHSYIKSQKPKLARKKERDWKRALYTQELMSSPFVRKILENAEIAQPLMFNGDYSYSVAPEHKRGDNFALIGDAAAFIDPIFASGVYLSMKTADLVASAVSKKLRSGPAAGDRALDAAYAKVNGAYALVDKAIRMFYNPVAVNFAQVGSASSLIHEQHENALAIGHYLLAGDFFQRHEEYSEFIDLLQNPKLLKKYKAFVIDRPDFQSTSCGISRVKVFHELLEEHAEKVRGKASA